jgi:hypothetical protein
MVVWASPRASHAHVLDSLFANAPGTGSELPASLPPVTASTSPPAQFAANTFGLNGVPAFQPTQPPPELQSPADLATAYEWFQNEKRHLEEYTRQAIAAIHQQHQMALARDAHREGALALQAQELNQEMRYLASQAQAIQQRTHELTLREAVLSAQLQKLAEAQNDFLSIQRTSEDVQKDTETQQA